MIGAEWWPLLRQAKKRKRARKAHTQVQAGKIFIMIGLEAQSVIRQIKHCFIRQIKTGKFQCLLVM